MNIRPYRNSSVRKGLWGLLSTGLRTTLNPGTSSWAEGQLLFGRGHGTLSERVKELSRPLSALFPVNVTNNIMGYLWSKQVDASVLFATALADMPIHEVVETPGMAP